MLRTFVELEVVQLEVATAEYKFSVSVAILSRHVQTTAPCTQTDPKSVSASALRPTTLRAPQRSVSIPKPYIQARHPQVLILRPQTRQVWLPVAEDDGVCQCETCISDARIAVFRV